MATVFGRITVSRNAYRAPCVSNVHPLDEVLALPDGLYSPGLARLCARESVRESFTDAAEAVEYATGVRVGTRQIIELTQAAAVDAGAFYTDRSSGLPEPDRDDAIVITADGKGVPVRPKALRPGTAKLAAKAKTAAAGGVNGGAGGKGNCKRVAELVCVYNLAPVPRTVEDILPALGDDPAASDGGDVEAGGDERARAPKAARKWLTASLVADIPTVIAAGFDEATRRDPGHDRDWVGLPPKPSSP